MVVSTTPRPRFNDRVAAILDESGTASRRSPTVILIHNRYVYRGGDGL
jgi:hypothetical protein